MSAIVIIGAGPAAPLLRACKAIVAQPACALLLDEHLIAAAALAIYLPATDPPYGLCAAACQLALCGFRARRQAQALHQGVTCSSKLRSGVEATRPGHLLGALALPLNQLAGPDSNWA